MQPGYLRDVAIVSVLGTAVFLTLAVGLSVIAAADDIAEEDPFTTIRRGRFAQTSEVPDEIRIFCWNIARGAHLESIIAHIKEASPDICILQELDINAKRTGRVNVPEEIARRLGYDYVFGTEFIELGQGSKDAPALHGQATLSRLPIRDAKVIRFEAQTGFWRPRWFIPNWSNFERRKGGRMVLRTTVGAGASDLVIYNTHLESRGKEKLRLAQMQEILSDVEHLPKTKPIVIAGDFNTRERPSPIIETLRETGFIGPTPHDQPTTAPRERSTAASIPVAFMSIFGADRGDREEMTLDWVFLRGPFKIGGGEIQTDAEGSDHYPLAVRVGVECCD